MPSVALSWWRTDAQKTMNDVVAVHAQIGGHGPGRRYATKQINNAYAVLLSSQFQKFCRDLHSQAADCVARSLSRPPIQNLLLARLTDGRKLDAGNPNPGNLGSDFNRFGFDFWKAISAADRQNAARRRRLEELNLWRNAIGHHDFAKPECRGRTAVRLHDVKTWRRACDGLGGQFDMVVARQLWNLTGVIPW